MSEFELPQLHFNPQFTWGPPAEEIVQDGQPVHLYFKSEPVHAVDWYAAVQEKKQIEAEANAEGLRSKHKRDLVVEDDNRLKAFEIYRNKARKFPAYRQMPNRMMPNPRGRNRFQQIAINGLPNTINVRSEQIVFGDFAQQELGKGGIALLPTVSDIDLYGRPLVFNAEMDKVSTKAPIKLQEADLSEADYKRPSAIEDANLVAIATDDDDKWPHIYTTDDVLSLLMTSYGSYNPWHIRVTKVNKKIFLYKDSEGNVDMQWVGETDFQGTRPAEDDTRITERISSLGKESTAVHQAFIRNSCTKSRAQVESKPSPFPKLRPRMYRYRRFTMNPNTPKRYEIVVRCDVDAVLGQTNDYVRLFGLLDHRVTSKDGTSNSPQPQRPVDTNSAAIILSAYEANACKISRWIALSTLSDVKQMKIGVVTRAEPMNANTHFVRTVQTNSPLSLATQLSVNVTRMWATIDALMQPLLQQEYGDAVVLKPSDALRIRIVEETNDEDEDEDEEGDEDEEEIGEDD